MAACEPISHKEDDEVVVFDPYEGMDAATRLLVRKLQWEDDQQRRPTKRQRRRASNPQWDNEEQASLELARRLHQQELQEQASLDLAGNLQCEDVVALLTLHNKAACDIPSLSFCSSEQESLLRPGTELRVIKRSKKGNFTHIEVEEVVNDEKEKEEKFSEEEEDKEEKEEKKSEEEDREPAAK